jgi:geranylgeranyl diphosphate synthase, type I
MAEPAAELDHVRDQVSRVLGEFLGRQRKLAAGISGELLPAIDAVTDVLAGGKRLRAAFCYWGWRGAGADSAAGVPGAADGDNGANGAGGDNGAGAGGDSRADRDSGGGIFAAAAALELLHAGALVHDDVLDDSDTRRGKPTVHRLFAARHAASGWRGTAAPFGKGMAILLGDLLLTWTDEMFHGSGLPPPALTRGRAVLAVMRTELMAGQYLDLLEQAAGTGGVAGPLRVVTYKTAKYTIERPLHLGAALAGPGAADPALIRGYTGYGLPLGVAFQLRDDLLGIFGDPAETGKPAGDDIREGKRTVLVAVAREKATARQAAALDRLLGDPSIGAAGVAEFRGLLADTGAQAECETMIDRYVTEALAALESAPVTPQARAALADLAIAATARTD